MRAEHWRAVRRSGQLDDEARRYLQARLTLFTQLMFFSFVFLMVFLSAIYVAYPEYAPPRNTMVFGGAAAALMVMVLLWRGLLARRELSLEWLDAIDLGSSACIGLAFAGSAVLSYPLRPAAYASLVYGVCTVFTRAIVVPSTGRRTVMVSTALFVPLVIAAGYLGIATTQELPGPAFFGGALLLSTVAIVLAATGSRIIYGLRRQVSEAMQLGQYTLGRKIGEGGMGAVYIARHALLRRPTAIKLLLPDRFGADVLDRFELEVQHMSQLTHPNTVAVFDYGRNPDGVLYYAMEYLDGIDLEQLVHSGGPQPIDRVVAILRQVAGALSEAHTAGFIHRDVKPANIILCQRGGVPDVAKVVDFGLVQPIAASGASTPNIVLGTPAYVAPEAVTDPSTIGPAIDLYALGAVGYFLVSGHRVFEGGSPVEICLHHVTTTPQPLAERAPDVPRELADLIMKLLAKRPADRFSSAAALVDALAALPARGDWTAAQAHEWWANLATHRATMAAAEHVPTRTMTIDLEQRLAGEAGE